MTATVSTLRALPGLDGAIHANLPTVDIATTDDNWNTTLDASQHVNYDALFKAIAADAHLEDAVRILKLNQGGTPKGRDLLLMAAKALRDNADVRAALTITLAPGQADTLAQNLDDASREPHQRCRWGRPGYGCNNWIVDKAGELCPMHQAAEDAGDPAEGLEPDRWGA